MLTFFAERLRGVWVAVLTVVSLGYGVLILQVLPWWRHLTEAQGGSELQATFAYGAADVARVFAAFDASLRTDALAFYAVDVPNAVLFGVSIAALMGFALRLLAASRSPLRWLIALPLVSGASDLVENACLAIALLTSPAEPSLAGALAGLATTSKLATGLASIPLMLLLLVAGIARWAWLKVKSRRA